MSKRVKQGLGIAALLVMLVATTAGSCSSTKTDQAANSEKMTKARNAKLASIVLCGEQGESNTCKNLAERKKRNEDPNRLTYIYLVNLQGDPYAYWVAKGPVTGTQSQTAPMDQAISMCSYAECWTPMEAPGDDGSFGPNEDGIFFYTVTGDEIELGGVNYILSDRPFDLPGVKELKFKA